MMMRMRPLLLVVPLLLVRCGSPPVHDHTLAVIPPAHRGGALPAGHLRVGEVDIPPVLDRNEIVTRASPTALTVHRQDVWAAPLSGLIQRTLSADLAARLGESRVLAVDDATSPPGTRTVTVSIRQFIADADGHVVLDADWMFRGRKADVSPRHAMITAQAAGRTPDAVAQAMSEALGMLADRIAASA